MQHDIVGTCIAVELIRLDIRIEQPTQATLKPWA